jgi:hypothetical protein
VIPEVSARRVHPKPHLVALCVLWRLAHTQRFPISLNVTLCLLTFLPRAGPGRAVAMPDIFVPAIQP